jgi:MFS transporter, OFA family, oxalate/formate antiporter
LGPMMVASIKDKYPDRAIIYSFLLGILVLGVGFVFSFLINDDRFIPRRILLQVFAAAPLPDVRSRKGLDRGRGEGQAAGR